MSREGPRWTWCVTWTEHARTLTLRTGSLEEAEEQAARAIERGCGEVVIRFRGTGPHMTHRTWGQRRHDRLQAARVRS